MTTKVDIPQDIQDLLQRLFVTWTPDKATLWSSKPIYKDRGLISTWMKLNPGESLLPKMGITTDPRIIYFQFWDDGVFTLLISLPYEETK